MANSAADSVILFCFLSLLLILIASQVKKKLRFPVYPSLLLLGMMLRALGNSSTALSIMIDRIDGLKAPTVQLAIVPVIVFEAAFLTDWYRFKKQFGQILPMASSVVILSAVFTAFLFQNVLQLQFSWEECLLLGLILSATDHVAVMSGMKDLNADEKLETLLGGETLINEATVLVIFNILRDSIAGETQPAFLFLYFLRLVFGGFSLGLVFAFTMGYLLKRMVNDYIQEMNLTLVTTYLLFWVCNNPAVQFSGALAVVTYGLYMSAYGKILISPIVEKQLHHMWYMISNYVQSLVFIIAGMILERFVIPGTIFTISDIGLLLAFFILQHFIRGLVIFLHYPILKYFGYGVNGKESIVLTMAGLKGVISSALALIAFNDTALNETFRSTVIFYTIGTVGLSICLDSLFLKIIIQRFKIDKLSAAKENILFSITTMILQETSRRIEKMKGKPDFTLVKWEEVLQIAGPKNLFVEIMGKSHVGKKILKNFPKESAEKLAEKYSDSFNLTEEILLNEIRERFYCILKGIYWSSFEAGECSGDSALQLISSCDRALDKTNEVMCDWVELKERIYNEKKMESLKRYTGLAVMGKVFRRLIYDRIISAYDISNTFVRAHSTAENIMESMEINIDKDLLIYAIGESHCQSILCQEFIKDFITDSYPEIIADVQSKMACFFLLNKQRKTISKIHEQGVIKELEYRHLLHALDSNLKQLTFMAKPKIPTLFEMLQRRFPKSTKAELKKMLPFIEEKHYQPNTYLFEKNNLIMGAYLIFSGTVNEFSDEVSDFLSISNIAGAYSLTDYCYTNYITSAVTCSVVIAAFIPSSLIITDHGLTEAIYKEAAKSLILHNKPNFGLSESTNEHIEIVIENSNIWHLEEGSPINLRRGALVLHGTVRKDKEIFSVLRPSKRIIESLSEAVLLIFPPHFGGILKQHRSLVNAFASYYIKHKRHIVLDQGLLSQNNSFQSFKSKYVHKD